MHKIVNKPISYLGAFLACAIMSLTAGCASGGFKLTREYAQFVNSQNVVIRVLLYIFTSVVFAVTMIVDLVFNNTMDFWNGRVSAGTYNFKDGDKTYQVRHEFLPETHRKRSTIKILNSDRKILHEIVFAELGDGKIECTIDGKLRSRVTGLNDIPVATNYDAKGQVESKRILWSSPDIATN